MKIRLNVKNIYIAKAVMILDKYPTAMQRLREIATDTYKICTINNSRVRECLVNDKPEKYVNVEDIEELLWIVINSVWVGDDTNYEDAANYGSTQIELEGEQEVANFIKLPSYLERLDKVDDLCRNLRKGWIDEGNYATGSEDEPYINVKYIQNELKRILD